MSLPPQSKVMDYQKYLNQYMANLNKEIQNQSFVYNAVSASISGDMSAVPQMPQDTRSVEEKLRDVENLKIKLNGLLLSLTDGANANEIVTSLPPELIQQAVQSFPSLYQTLKPIWSLGVPSVIFIQALKNLSMKQDITAGIEMNLQQSNAGNLQMTNEMLRALIDGDDLDEVRQRISSMPIEPKLKGGLLQQISYVKGLIAYKGELPDRIAAAREMESMAGEDMQIPNIIDLPSKQSIYTALEQLEMDIDNGDNVKVNTTARNILEYISLPDDVIADLEEFNNSWLNAPISRKPSRETEEQTMRVRGQKNIALAEMRGQPPPAELLQQESFGSSKPRSRGTKSAMLPSLRVPEEETKEEQKVGRKVGKFRLIPATAESEIDQSLTPIQLAEKRQELKSSLASKRSKSLEGDAGGGGRTPTAMAFTSAEEPVQAEVFTGRMKKAIEEGSFEDLLQQLAKSDARTRVLALGALEQTGGNLEMNGNVVSIDVIKTGSSKKVGDPASFTYWINKTNVRDLYDLIQSRKPIEGTGVKKSKNRRMSGKGVCFTIKEEAEVKPSSKKPIKLKIAGVIEKEPAYMPFGRYAINKFKLSNDILMLRSPKGGALPKLPSQKISNKLSKILSTIMEKGVPSFEMINDLITTDQEVLHKILQEAQIQSISTPNPARDKNDEDFRRFTILRGEIVAGNNNPSLVKELKRLIVKLMSRDILPKREAQNAILELTLIEM
jgi:hypothetical protein